MIVRKLATERSINKAIYPLTPYQTDKNDFPYKITEDDNTKYIISGYWTAREFMALDVISTIWLNKFCKKNNNGTIPKSPYDDIIKQFAVRPRDYNLLIDSNAEDVAPQHLPITNKELRGCWPVKASIAEMYQSITGASVPQMNLIYQVRIFEDDKKMKEGGKYKTLFYDNTESSPEKIFHVDSTEETIGKDGKIYGRDYILRIDPILGHFFLRNIMSINIDWLDLRFYSLSSKSQLFYRKLILLKKYERFWINLDTVRARLYPTNNHSSLSNLCLGVESILNELQEKKFIIKWEKSKHSYRISQEKRS